MTVFIAVSLVVLVIGLGGLLGEELRRIPAQRY